jgi:hypothetical protein
MLTAEKLCMVPSTLEKNSMHHDSQMLACCRYTPYLEYCLVQCIPHDWKRQREHCRRTQDTIKVDFVEQECAAIPG